MRDKTGVRETGYNTYQEVCERTNGVRVRTDK